MPLIGREVYRLPDCPVCGAPAGEPCLDTCPVNDDDTADPRPDDPSPWDA